MRPDKSLPLVSVVIPVFNGGSDLEKCVAAIYASSFTNFECILVDDASSDGMAARIAERHGAKVIRLDQQHGPASARNRGAEQATGEILFFTDADVELHPDTLELAVQALQSDPEIAAVFGSYDDQPRHPAFISQYRNLFHHWVHQTSIEEATTFWTGCGAIRRRVFMEMDGFNHAYAKPCIEDIEFGMRLCKAGHKIRLLKNMLCTHMKQWKLWGMIRTDVFQRGVPWMVLLLQNQQMTNELNLSYKSRIATFFAGLFGLFIPVFILAGHAAATFPTLAFLFIAAIGSGIFDTSRKRVRSVLFIAAVVLVPVAIFLLLPDPLALIPIILVAPIIVTHQSFYRYVASKRGLMFATAVAPMQVIFFLCCAVSIPLGYFEHYLVNKGRREDST